MRRSEMSCLDFFSVFVSNIDSAAGAAKNLRYNAEHCNEDGTFVLLFWRRWLNGVKSDEVI